MKIENSSCDEKKDLISTLPDSLILLILSMLYTKHAVQTCLVSKRFKHLWRSLPVLRFDDCFHFRGCQDESAEEECDCDEEECNCDEEDECDEEDNEAIDRFITFVDKVLSGRAKNCDIHSLYIECQRYYLRDEYHEVGRCIDRCIKYAVKNKVQELYIHTNTLEDFEIPVCLSTCKSLRKVNISLHGDNGTKIILPREISLPDLKSLHLSVGYMPFNDEELTRRFFSSLPALESLVIFFYGLGSGFGDTNIRISLPKLRYFKFGSRNYENNGMITLNTPSLASLDFGGTICAQRMAGIMRGIRSVKSICLNDSLLKNFGGALDILGTHPLILKNLQHLELETYLSMDCMRSICYILKKSPNMDSVAVCIPKKPETVSMEHFAEDYWDVESSSHLKFVKINGILGFANELKFVEVLLKHAMVLEKVILKSASTKKDSKRVKKRMKNFRKKVRAFSKASKKVHILFKF